MSIPKILDIELLGFIYALVAIVASGLLTSRINTKGLLLDKSGSGRIRPERLQVLITTMIIAARYLGEVFSGSTGSSFPAIDPAWLYLAGGSNGIYVARKIYERFGISGDES
jgi:hypothetical protein